MFAHLTPARRGNSPCGCDGSGWYLLEVGPEDPRFAQLQRCSCGAAGRAAAPAILERLRDELAGLAGATFESFDLERRLESFGPPEALIGAAAQRRQLTQALRIAQAYAESPIGWLYIHGPCGAGKSHLAAAIAHTRAAQGARVLYRSTPGLLDALRPSGDLAGAAETMRAILHADLLVLDDLGAERATPWAIERIFQVLNDRAARPTIVTSNLDLDAIEEQSDPRIASRLRMAVPVWMPISDYRRLIGAAGRI